MGRTRWAGTGGGQDEAGVFKGVHVEGILGQRVSGKGRDDMEGVGLKDKESVSRLARPGDAAAVETLMLAVPKPLLPVGFAPVERRESIGVDFVLKVWGAAEHGHEEGRLTREPIAEHTATRVATT